MKYRYLLIGLLSTLALSCTVSEIYAPEGPEEGTSPKKEVFYVSIDEQPGAETKVYADENLRVRWNEDDRITVFNLSTFNREYRFDGKTGDNSGEIIPVGADAEGYAPIDSIYAIYPYQEKAMISKGVNGNGIVSFTLPEIQNYEPNSFGIGANTMISVTDPDDKMMIFKNVGGYLAFKLCGPGVKVSSITLRGANNEPLAGPATIQMTGEGPKVDIASATASARIKLYCKEPVELGSDPTVFWFVVPPVEFPNGFRVTVATPDGKTFIQRTSKPFSVRRSAVTRMASFEVNNLIPSTATMRIDEISSTRQIAKNDGTSQSKPRKYIAELDEDGSTYTILLPTVTDSSNVSLMDFSFTGDELLVNGQKVSSGVSTTVDVSGGGATLTVCKGDAEKRFKLKIQNTGLPVVRITTEGFTRGDIENDTSHETWRGTGRKDSDGNVIKTENAFLRIDMPDGSPGLAKVKDNGSEEPAYEVKMQIKGRGNATWKYRKRPYALKLDGGRKVLGMPKHKRWILLANWKDRTLLRNDAAFWLSGKTGLPYTVKGQFVELEFNGVHMGNYYLCEQIKIDENRVNINEFSSSDVTGGYLMEIDNNYDEAYKFLSGFYGKTSNNKFTPYGLKYMFKEPDEDLPNGAFEHMQGFIQTMEDYIKKIPQGNYGYRDYLDMDSAIWFMFVQELTGNGDFFNTDSDDVSSTYYGPHSTYFYKDIDVVEGDVVTRSKLHMGPVWDFDYHTFIYERTRTTWSGRVVVEESRWNKWVGANNSNYYYYYLCKDPVFRSRMESLWAGYKTIVSSDAFSLYINGMADYIRQSEAFNTEMWGWDQTSGGQDQGQNGDNDMDFQPAVNELIRAYSAKLGWMNTNLPNLNK